MTFSVPNSLLVIIALVIWIGCGVISYGLTFAYFQREFSLIAEARQEDDKKFALFMGLLGPFGLIVSMVGVAHTIGEEFHGFMFQNPWEQSSMESFLIPEKRRK